MGPVDELAGAPWRSGKDSNTLQLERRVSHQERKEWRPASHEAVAWGLRGLPGGEGLDAVPTSSEGDQPHMKLWPEACEGCPGGEGLDTVPTSSEGDSLRGLPGWGGLDAAPTSSEGDQPHVELWPGACEGCLGGEGLDTSPTSSEGDGRHTAQGGEGLDTAPTSSEGDQPSYEVVAWGLRGLPRVERGLTRRPPPQRGVAGTPDHSQNPGSQLRCWAQARASWMAGSWVDGWVFRGTPETQPGCLDIEVDGWVFWGTPRIQPGSLDIQGDSWVFRGTPGT